MFLGLCIGLNDFFGKLEGVEQKNIISILESYWRRFITYSIIFVEMKMRRSLYCEDNFDDKGVFQMQ